ncbi:MAG: hypothetical protein O8C64_13980, partial [Candidatus Methanoperedens sp.]|nr:hypothetical protein [Candidatus Methanoperedens sp.]
MKSKNIFILIIVFVSVSVFASSANGSAIVIKAPPDNYLTNSSVVTVSGEADPGAVLSLNGASLSNNNGIYSKNITLVEGLNRIIVTAKQNGNISTATANVTLDTGPEVKITSPDTKYVNTSPLNVSYTSNATDVESYRVRLDKQEWVVTNETYYLFNTTEGPAFVEVQAIDHSGNIGEASLNLTVDTIMPLMEITKPVINEPILSRIVEISGRSEIGANITVNGQNFTNNNGTWSGEILLWAVNN